MERRFAELAGIGAVTLLDAIVPYRQTLPHADGMIDKVRDFVLAATEGHQP